MSDTTHTGTDADVVNEALDEVTDEELPQDVTPDPVKADDSGDDEFKVDVSLEDVPSTLRPKAEAYIKELEKQFKSAYTKKTQGLAQTKKDQDLEVAQLQKQVTEFENIAMEVLRDPDKLQGYRQVYGFGPSTTDKSTPKEDEIGTVGDMVSLWRKELKDFKREVQIQSKQENEASSTTQRWETALVRLRADPKFKKYESMIVARAKTEPVYKRKYLGNNEWEVLSDVYEDVKSLMRTDIESARKEERDSLTTKRRKTTATPTKTAQTVSAKDGALTKEQIIARVQERLGKNERQEF